VSTVIEIGGNEFRFCAAHTGMHVDGLEPLHGHTFMVVMRLAGDVNAAGMVSDFGRLKAGLRQAIAPLRGRTLVATEDADIGVQAGNGRVRFGDGHKHYDLPAGDVVLLPIVNTTTEAIAKYLLDQIAVDHDQGLAWAELTLAEAPGVAATVRRDLP
jgi:6-pyruvoyltetrahydropterin/6-carboxytetrahydropterin synthase